MDWSESCTYTTPREKLNISWCWFGTPQMTHWNTSNVWWKPYLLQSWCWGKKVRNGIIFKKVKITFRSLELKALTSHHRYKHKLGQASSSVTKYSQHKLTCTSFYTLLSHTMYAVACYSFSICSLRLYPIILSFLPAVVNLLNLSLRSCTNNCLAVYWNVHYFPSRVTKLITRCSTTQVAYFPYSTFKP